MLTPAPTDAVKTSAAPCFNERTANVQQMNNVSVIKLEEVYSDFLLVCDNCILYINAEK